MHSLFGNVILIFFYPSIWQNIGHPILVYMSDSREHISLVTRSASTLLPVNHREMYLLLNTPTQVPFVQVNGLFKSLSITLKQVASLCNTQARMRDDRMCTSNELYQSSTLNATQATFYCPLNVGVGITFLIK
ncbi:hypothetical protein AMTRI_Chr09g16000 [Amborella trichopoda]